MNLGRDAFTITYDPSKSNKADFQKAITVLGYKPRIATLETPDETPEEDSQAPVPEPVATALDKARQARRFVFVDFYAEWCLPCKVLEEKTITEARVQEALQAYEFQRVDTDEFPDAGEHYAIQGMPTVLVLDWNGREYRQVGLIAAQELAQKLIQLRSDENK